MMRSLFSGVAGLKTHQTRMDVIGNNIANVNTTAYKSQSMVFNDLLYQTTQAASGANAATGRGGTNARQIGLGSKTGAISTAITQQGSAQSTNNPFDIMISGESFFVVSNGSENFFTRDGSFTVDGAGNLVMSSTGYTVMGWGVDPTTGEISPDIVSPLQIMNADNLTYPPESTTKAYVSGILDKNDTNVNTTQGRVITLSFYDQLGYKYTAKFGIHSAGSEGQYYVGLNDILDEAGVSLVKKYNLNSIEEIASFGGDSVKKTSAVYSLLEGVTYDDGTKTYTKTMALSEILEGYSSNLLINKADKSSIKVDGLADGAVAKGTDVKVKGKVSLSEAQLKELGIIKEKKADGSYAYYHNNNGTAEELGADKDKWKAALKDAGVTDLDSVDTTSDPNSVSLNFTQTFKTNRDSTYKTPDFTATITQLEAYGLEDTDTTKYSVNYVTPLGQAEINKTVTQHGFSLAFDTDTGKFSYVDTVGNNTVTLAFNKSASSLTGETVSLTQFTNIDIDFSSATMFNNGKTSTIGATNGDKDGNNTGRKLGEMTGVEVGQDGKITASYDNGQTKLLGQIAVANFANASGLSKAGNNLYSATMNSGEFDGVGQDITADGGTMESGVLEMSNVDLSSEFTQMITTQRGFQANSRIISTSDTMLEELVNLKR